MFSEIKTLLVERNINCPNCEHSLKIGDTMYEDEYRNETVCGYCLDDYKEEVILEEGEDGELLK